MRFLKSKFGWYAVGIFVAYSLIALWVSSTCTGWFCGLDEKYIWQYWPILVLGHFGLEFDGLPLAVGIFLIVLTCIATYYILGYLIELFWEKMKRAM